MDLVILIVNLVMLAGLGVIGYLIKSYLPSYFQEKGKNLATKEDIEEITRKVESVKAEMDKSTRVDDTKYKLKYDACIQALALIDAHFSHS